MKALFLWALPCLSGLADKPDPTGAIELPFYKTQGAALRYCRKCRQGGDGPCGLKGRDRLPFEASIYRGHGYEKGFRDGRVSGYREAQEEEHGPGKTPETETGRKPEQ